MRIGLVIHRLDPRRGGVEQWTWSFARWLVAQGHEVDVVAREFHPQTAPLGIRPHEIEPGLSRLAFGHAAESVLRRIRPDIIHDTGAGWYCDVFQPHGGSRAAAHERNLLLAPRWLRPCKRRFARALPRYRQFDQLLARQYANDGRTVVALSRMVAGHLERYHHVPPARMRLVYNGVDVVRFQPPPSSAPRQRIRQRLGIDESSLLLLLVAHNHRLKGVATLLAAAARLQRRGVDLHVAIVGGKRSGFTRRAERTIRGRVHFAGSVDDASPWYAAADVYVQPTWYDPCSLTVLEALACGLPVITSGYNGAGELLQEGVQGFVVTDPADHQTLADRISMLTDPARRGAMSRAARDLALAHTFERNCREMLDVYRQAAAMRPAA